MNEKSITTRYPEDLYAAIKKRAAESGRSFNAEVIHELHQYQLRPAPKEKLARISEEDLNRPELSIEETWKRYCTE